VDAKGSKILGNLDFKDRSFGALLTKIEGISTPCPIVAFVKDLNPNKNSFSFTPSEKKKISSDPKLKKAAEKSGLDMSDLLGALTGGMAPQGKGYITGQ
jgi:hypothetical protein